MTQTVFFAVSCVNLSINNLYGDGAPSRLLVITDTPSRTIATSVVEV